MISIDDARRLSKEGKASPPPKIRKRLPPKDPILSGIRIAGDTIASAISSAKPKDQTPLILDALKEIASSSKNTVVIRDDRPKQWEFKISRDERQRITKVRAIAVANDRG